MKVTNSLKEKLEGIFKSQGFVVRYEKGNFNSGYCILENKNVIVINKFFPLESKVNAMIEIIRQIEINSELVEPNQQKLIAQITQTELEF